MPKGNSHQAKAIVAAAINWRGCRRQVLRGYLYDLLGREAQAVGVSRNGQWTFAPTNDYVGRETFMFGGFELDVMRTALDMAERYSGRALRGRRFIDVGANIGTTTVAAICTFGASDVVAVEPSPDNLRFLRANVAANGVAERVEVVQAVLSDHSGTCVLELSGQNSGDHRVRTGAPAPGALGEEHRSTAETTAMTFDELLADTELDEVGLVWMDTQGHEAHVLAGASRLLASNVPVVMEYFPYALRRASGLERLQELISANYRTVVDVRTAREMKAADVCSLEALYPGVGYTDLVLIR